MKSFSLFKNQTPAALLCETGAYPGVKRIAQTIADDISLVTGIKPAISTQPGNLRGGNAVIFATLGRSAWLDSFISRKLINTAPIAGKRECFMISLIETPFEENPGIRQALVILGSDKRGTIYGMFHLSQMCGVSPLVFWGDAAPLKKDCIELAFDDDIISKEPSVRYRGFFINDEWPAFGNWCTGRYGDVNAKAYDEIFKLLLRLKGNYLWPAMWNSSFSEDGPGLDSARLADEYGVVMGASHHEPMCRAGVEWQQQYDRYGDDNTWSFVTNSKAITEFWKDGIIRNKDFENVITIGMRGENDSLLMGGEATVEDNINILKDAIRVQNNLIKQHINPNLREVPRMFAIYKEVEDFYFGHGGSGGLRGFEELEDVILLFSDDNHGILRAIPQIGEKKHSGGYGMYYHFDYHGGPVSFEWLNHTNLVRTWQQMTLAYEHGIKDMWIVNVGDIKGNEYQLSYFLALAYDYGKWGINNANSAHEYTAGWIDTTFGTVLDSDIKEQIHALIDSYIKWSTVRIPESLNADVFKNDFHEADNACKEAEETIADARHVLKALPVHCRSAYESMIYYPLMAFFSALRVNLTAALNHVHAKRGTLIANDYAKQLQAAIEDDRHYIDEFHRFNNGKWNHMMASAHMCFRTWDDNDWTYPVIMNTVPIPHPKIVVSCRGYNTYTPGHHWQDKVNISNSELTRPDIDSILIDIDVRGNTGFDYTVTCDKPWLCFSKTGGSVSLSDRVRDTVKASCIRDKLCGDDTAVVRIDFTFSNGKTAQAFADVKASNNKYEQYSGAFIELQDYISIHADNFAEAVDVENNGWRAVTRLGRTTNAIRTVPVTKQWGDNDNRPYVRYDFYAQQTGTYNITFYLAPRNPMVKGAMIRGCYAVNDSGPEMFDIIGGSDYITNESDARWSTGAMNCIRKVSVCANLKEGMNSLKFYAVCQGVILEDIVMHPVNTPLPQTHLPPPESYRVP